MSAYRPGVRPAKPNTPSALLVTVRLWLVAVLTTVIATPGSTPPVSSDTLPASVAVTVPPWPGRGHRRDERKENEQQDGPEPSMKDKPHNPTPPPRDDRNCKRQQRPAATPKPGPAASLTVGPLGSATDRCTAAGSTRRTSRCGSTNRSAPASPSRSQRLRVDPAAEGVAAAGAPGRRVRRRSSSRPGRACASAARRRSAGPRRSSRRVSFVATCTSIGTLQLVHVVERRALDVDVRASRRAGPGCRSCVAKSRW